MTDILDLIDGALRDYGTSTDAMRWTPEPTADAIAVGDTFEAIAAGNIVAHQMLTHAGPGIVTALPPPPSREDGRTMLDDIRDLSQRIMQDQYDRPLPARIEVDNVALIALRTLVVARTRPPWAGVIGDPFGIPIHINPDLPRGGWRVLDRDGNVLNEGTVLPPGHVRIECEGTVIYEGPIGEWPPVRPARPLPMCDGGEMVMVTDVGVRRGERS